MNKNGKVRINHRKHSLPVGSSGV